MHIAHCMKSLNDPKNTGKNEWIGIFEKMQQSLINIAKKNFGVNNMENPLYQPYKESIRNCNRFLVAKTMDVLKN